MLLRSHPAEAKQLLQEAQINVASRYHLYEYLAARDLHQAARLPHHQGYHLPNP
jgi:pyruvate-ferredoxin/flavodoxin oxidoreductase